jgi:hypothetical protein
MHSTAYLREGLSGSEADLNRRTEEQRIRAILEPKDDEARQQRYAARAAMQRRQAEAEEHAKTDRCARGLLWSILGTVLLALVSSMWNIVA